MFELVGDSPTTVANVGEGPGCLDLSFTCNTWRAKNLPPPPLPIFQRKKGTTITPGHPWAWNRPPLLSLVVLRPSNSPWVSEYIYEHYVTVSSPVSNMWRSSKCTFCRLLPPKTTTLLPTAVHVWNERGSGCRPVVGVEIHSKVSETSCKVLILFSHYFLCPLALLI